uniref:Uncharacterized protein n=1 Tax=Molossus molossus TaxID=27622 RepID=A0A7J8IA98_MOLMO|nr:hypothetical protein HJG59_010696 [Molossus molossus]
MPSGAGKPHLWHLPSRSTAQERRANSAATASSGSGSSLPTDVSDQDKDFCGRDTRCPAVTSGLAASLLPPSPPHPFGSSDVGPKSLGPTTTNRHHRFGNVSVGAGVGEPTRCSSSCPRAVLVPRLSSQQALRAVL